MLTIAATLAVTGGPAAAHAGGLTATDARGRVVSVTPAVPGLEITAIESGARLRLRNGTPDPVTIKPGGGTATPSTIPPGAELTWIDERSTPDGRSVAAGETVEWTVPLDMGGTEVVVTGVLVGEQSPTAAIWWLASVLTGATIILLARRTRRADRLLATAGTLAATASIIHVTGSTLAVESAPPAGTFLNAAGINLLAWPLIIGGAVTTFRGRAAGVLAVCGGAALTAVFVLPDVTSFHRAVLPFEGPAALERILVVLALGLGIGVAVAGAGVLRDLAQKATPDTPTTADTPTTTDTPAADPATSADARSAGEPSNTVAHTQPPVARTLPCAEPPVARAVPGAEPVADRVVIHAEKPAALSEDPTSDRAEPDSGGRNSDGGRNTNGGANGGGGGNTDADGDGGGGNTDGGGDGGGGNTDGGGNGDGDGGGNGGGGNGCGTTKGGGNGGGGGNGDGDGGGNGGGGNGCGTTKGGRNGGCGGNTDGGGGGNGGGNTKGGGDGGVAVMEQPPTADRA
ncbi:hypothetical protein [Actinoplanes subglobosus]|uniref:Uncharacterized protein n=1 Tax=Actinoplanes subglobosus TaxID=1547892 RepID=A0ABV8IXW0_9ACTN